MSILPETKSREIVELAAALALTTVGLLGTVTGIKELVKLDLFGTNLSKKK